MLRRASRLSLPSLFRIPCNFGKRSVVFEKGEVEVSGSDPPPSDLQLDRESPQYFLRRLVPALAYGPFSGKEQLRLYRFLPLPSFPPFLVSLPEVVW